MTLSRLLSESVWPPTSTWMRFRGGISGQHFRMDPKTLLLKQLDEAHAMETALVTNLTAHAAMTSDGQYRRLLERHERETREQVEAIEKLRAALGSSGGRGIVSVTTGFARDAVGQVLV